MFPRHWKHCAKKSGRQIYMFSHALVYYFTPGSTYENLQGYLTLYSNFCAPTTLSSSSDSWCCCFCAQNVFSWGINLHRKRFSREQFAASTPSTLLVAQSGKKEILKGFPKIEFILLFIFGMRDRPRNARSQHTVPCFSSWASLCREGHDSHVTAGH